MNGLGDLLYISHVDRMIGAASAKALRDQGYEVITFDLEGADTVGVTSTGHDRNFG